MKFVDAYGKARNLKKRKKIFNRLEETQQKQIPNFCKKIPLQILEKRCRF